MLKDAQGIDSSAIQDLRAIKEELVVLHERMDLMEKKRDTVSQQVFNRVYADYEARQAALEEQAEPLKDVVRSEYSKINAMVEQLEEKTTKARLVREELEFRKELGEFDEEEFQEKLEESQQELEQAESELAEITGLRDEIAGAFPSADDLLVDTTKEKEEEPVADKEVEVEETELPFTDEEVEEEETELPVADKEVEVEETELPVVEKTVVMAVPPETEEVVAADNKETTEEMEVSVEEDELPEEPFDAGDEEPDERPPLPETEKLYDDETAVVEAPPRLDTAEDEETTAMEAPDEAAAPLAPPPYQAPAAPESFSNGSTAAMATTGRLVAPGEYGSEQVYRLKPSVTSIGRLDINDISIHNGAVSRYHAKVALTEDGFKIYDLDSENGVFVNGERITEHLLNDGDRIELGPGTKRFVFRCP
jgi:hypothetical protein